MTLVGRFGGYRVAGAPLGTESLLKAQMQKGRRASIVSALGPIVTVRVAGMNFGAMEREATVGLFARFVAEEALETGGYRITGHNVPRLTWLIKDPDNANDALGGVSYNDGLEFMKWLERETGKKLDFLTEEEFLAAEATGRLQSSVYRNWVKDCYGGTEKRILCSVGDENNDQNFPWLRYPTYGLRFKVEL